MIDEVILEFKKTLEGVTAVFLDARQGFQLLQSHIELDAGNRDWSERIYYGNGPSGKADTVLHSTTIVDRIGRNACDADNCVFISNMALVSIYGYWEDSYRQKIADSRNCEKSSVTSDIFGDIRLMRQSILHDQGKASKRVANAKILKWFCEGDDIFLNEDMYIQMMTEIYEYLDSLRS